MRKLWAGKLPGRELCSSAGDSGELWKLRLAGQKRKEGRTLGVLPGIRREDANPWIDVAILSGMGHARNALIAQSSDALIAVGGEYGTLSEISLGLKMGKPVVVLESKWKIEGTQRAKNPKEAVETAFRLIEKRTG